MKKPPKTHSHLNTNYNWSGWISIAAIRAGTMTATRGAMMSGVLSKTKNNKIKWVARVVNLWVRTGCKLTL